MRHQSDTCTTFSCRFHVAEDNANLRMFFELNHYMPPQNTGNIYGMSMLYKYASKILKSIFFVVFGAAKKSPTLVTVTVARRSGLLYIQMQDGRHNSQHIQKSLTRT